MTWWNTKQPHIWRLLSVTGRLFDQNALASQQVINRVFHRADLVAKWQWVFAAEEQAFVHFATESCRQFQVDTELTNFVQAIAQATLGQAVDALGATARVVFGIGLQGFLAFQIAF